MDLGDLLVIMVLYSIGVIQLWNQPVKLDLDKYELNVTAADDGSCCKTQNGVHHTSTALVIVSVTDVNDNKPVFTNCSDYERKRPTVMEEKPQGTYVTTVNDLLWFHIKKLWVFLFEKL